MNTNAEVFVLLVTKISYVGQNLVNDFQWADLQGEFLLLTLVPMGDLGTAPNNSCILP